MKYYLIAGEASGDLHGSNLMKGILESDPEASFRFWGGDLMQAVGGFMVRHYKETAVMGLWDVVTHLGKIRNNFATCRRDILEHRPDLLILIDYPGFNLSMAEFAHSHGIKVYYYIAPKTWASKEYRVKTIRRVVDRLYTIFPFETAYFKRFGIDVHFFGNPTMDSIESRIFKGESREEFCQRNGLDVTKPVVALLAGSRTGELKYNLPVMLREVALHPECQFVIAGAPSFGQGDYEKYLTGYPQVKVVFGETYQLLAQARCAIVTSGTATLETALMNCPQVVLYLMWGGGFSDFIAKRLIIKVPYISLVNLNLNRRAVEELFQKSYNPEKMHKLVDDMLADTPYRAKMLSDYAELQRVIGDAGCSYRAAYDMVNNLKEGK
ncbi:MAG: lipid-A-disaccharide synthase [Marinilabiliaceae bacterium]|nr:lipid-A-disaccharide synthase [Marinilabiliaceae bacterium]